MRTQTTLILLLLVAGLLGAWWWLQSVEPEDSSLSLGKPLFADYQAKDTRGIQIQHARTNEGESTPIVISLDSGGWRVAQEGRTGSTPAKARVQAIREIVETMEDLRARRLLNPDPDELESRRLGLGTERTRSLRITTADGKTFTLDVGAEVGEGDVVCRTSESKAAFAIASELTNSLFPTLLGLEDPNLFELSPLDIKAIKVQASGHTTFELAWDFSRWLLRAPMDGLPADPIRCDQLRRSVLTLQAVERFTPGSLPPWTETPAGRIELLDRTDRIHHVEWMVEDGGRVLVKSSARDEILAIKSASLETLDLDWRRYRDPRLFDITSNQMLRVQVEHADEKTPGFIIKRANEKDWVFTHVAGRPVLLHHGDPVDVATWMESLRNLSAARFDDASAAFEPVSTVRLLCALGAGSEGTEIEMTCGKPVAGLVPVRISGLPGIAWLEQRHLDFLDQPYYELLERVAWMTDAYFRLGRIEISDPEGTTRRFQGFIDRPNSDLTIRSLSGLQWTDVPEATTRAFQILMVGGFRIKEYIGTTKREEFGFQKPTLTLKWIEPNGASTDGIPESDVGEERLLTIGSRRTDGLYYGILEPRPGLVFLVDESSPRPILSLHGQGQ